MATDTIIDDIHKVREEYAKRFNNDLKAICNDARSNQGQGGREVVPAHSKPVEPDGMIAKLNRQLWVNTIKPT